MKNTKSAAKNLLIQLFGAGFFTRLYRLYGEYTNKKFSKQKCVNLRIGKFEIKAPRSHLLVQIQETQSDPYRDMAIGYLAGILNRKYPDGEYTDVGANIGDTAAIVANFCEWPMALVEPSDYYHALLLENIKVFKNKSQVHKCFLSSTNEIIGEFKHWGGTAVVLRNAEHATTKHQAKKLGDVASEQTRLVKIDTDGFDYSIIQSAGEFLKKNLPVLLYENGLYKEGDDFESVATLEFLKEIGYKSFLFLDDSGLQLLVTEDLKQCRSLIKHLKDRQSAGKPLIGNYDICAFSEADQDILAGVETRLSRPASWSLL